MTRTCVFLAALVSFAPASNARAQSNPDQREVLTIMKWHRVAAGLVVNIALPGNVTNQAGSHRAFQRLLSARTMRPAWPAPTGERPPARAKPKKSSSS
jgi:hypothetical protein